MIKLIKEYSIEITCSILCLTLGIISGYVVDSGKSDWYIYLNKPSFNPPSWVFAPVWSILYILMGIALAKIIRLKSENKRILLLFFIIQFAINLIWSPIFFYFHKVNFAFLDICLLWLVILILIIKARYYRILYLLFLPYLFWVSFALILNYMILILN